MFSTNSLAALCIFASLSGSAAAPGDAHPNPKCKRFDEIYATGKELCENMWDEAFKYETDETEAYTMWFFHKENPNNAISKGLGKLDASGHDTCHLSYYHRDTPGPEPETHRFTECHPWKNEACCYNHTVESATKLKEGYGKEYHWDRCGPLTPECERFFVQEACFYECDPNAGLWRKWHPSIYDKSNEDHNEWQMYKMPIKASYCDAWFAACRNDKFCASDGGSYFSCASEYEQVDKYAQLQAQLAAAEAAADLDSGLDTGLIVGLVSAGVVIFGLCVFGGCLISRERAGKPMFGKLLDQPGSNTLGAQNIGSSNI